MQFVTFVEADENDSSPMCTLVLTRKREEAGHSDARSTASEFQRLCPSHGAMWRTPRPYVHTDVHTQRVCECAMWRAPPRLLLPVKLVYMCVCRRVIYTVLLRLFAHITEPFQRYHWPSALHTQLIFFTLPRHSYRLTATYFHPV